MYTVLQLRHLYIFVFLQTWSFVKKIQQVCKITSVKEVSNIDSNSEYFMQPKIECLYSNML